MRDIESKGTERKAMEQDIGLQVASVKSDILFAGERALEKL